MLTISFQDACFANNAIGYYGQLVWNLASGDTLTLEDLSVLDKLR
ncbi:hypothetical protein [Nostoc sp.]